MSHASRRDDLSVVAFDYLIGTPAGIEHRRETHVMGLFTRDEMMTSFAAAGLEADYDPVGPMGRGLYVAKAA